MLSFVACARADAPKREVPDYDGRGGEPTTAGDVALWVPRTLLFPLYLTSEYAVRRPLGALIAGAERSGLPWGLYDLFTFGSAQNAGVVPIAFLDFGFEPSVGVYSFWNDAFFEGNDLRFHASTWGADWIAVSATERVHKPERSDQEAVLSASFVRRPDYLFFGIGPESREREGARFGMETLEVHAGIDERLWRSSALRLHAGMRRIAFHRGHLGGDPVLDDAIAADTTNAPPGYDESHTLAQETTSLVIDSRPASGPLGSGMRLEATATLAADMTRSAGWIKYGGAASGFVDLNDSARVVSLSLITVFTDVLAGREIPFTEQAQLGGFEPMRGYYPGRLVDRSAAVADLGYRWPVWIFLDGAIHLEVGNVFDRHLAGFAPGLLRFSGSIGLESHSRDNPLQIMFGVGSETFASGAKIDSIRFLVGTTNGV